MTERRELTFDDVLQFAGVHEAQSRLERLMPDPATLPDAPSTSGCDSASCRCGKSDASNPLFDKPLDRRGAIGTLVGALAVVTQAATACSPLTVESDEEREAKLLARKEFFKDNYRRMSPEERTDTIRRLERLAKLHSGVDVNIKTTEALPEVLYGYAFNISKCKGFRNCVQACIEENNLDRRTDTQYIRIFEMEEGSSINDLDHGSATYGHAVPAEGHFYMVTTGVWVVGTALRPAPTGPAASTGDSRRCRPRGSIRTSTIWATANVRRARSRSAPSASSGAERDGYLHASRHAQREPGSSGTSWTPILRSAGCSKTKNCSGSKRS